MPEQAQKIPIGVSSCLLGARVRHDGRHKYNANIVEILGKYFEFLAFCPEVAIGLGVPRQTVHLIKHSGRIRCIGTVDPDLDITERLVDCANQQKHWQSSISGYIFKKNSPSCGPGNVKVREGTEEHLTGTGIYARQLMENFPHLPIVDEQDLSDSTLRENFIKRVIDYQRWQALKALTPGV